MERRGAARVRRRARGRRHAGRLDARQDRRPGPGRGRVPEPPLHERVRLARGRHVPLRASCAAPTGWSSTTASSCASASSASSARRRPATRRAVLAWMEEWLQTEWPRPARLADVGDRAVGDRRRRRARLARRCSRRSPTSTLDARRASRSWRSARARSPGIPARICRVSFSGELAFEVNVDGRRGLELWEAIHGAGERDAVRHRGDARPARREGLPDHRPGDRRHRDAAGPRPGLDRLEDEAGLRRQALVRARPTPRAPTASSSSACCRDASRSPRARSSAAGERPGDGHVTSSYRSAALGRPFALALLAARPRAARRDRARRRRRRADVTDPVLYDPEGARRDGVAAELRSPRRSRVRGDAARVPVEPNTTATSTTRLVLWLGPDEWLVLGGARGRLHESRLRRRVSANRVVVRARRRRRAHRARARAARSTCAIASCPAAARRRCSRARR